ncbi:MAG: PD40 domain-containing protein [Bdellovibrionales bacterium]|nr:PD40 domain-containing protein [Bdellovibrionales bacterium]
MRSAHPYKGPFIFICASSFFCAFSFLSLLSGCKTGSVSSTSAQSLPTPAGYELPATSALPIGGENTRGKFSYGGDKILFISRDRLKHSQPQAYEYDLKTQKDRRITFQNGEVFDVAYSSEPHHFYYSSTTDEIKENPEFIRSALAKKSPDTLTNFFGETLPPTEIYESTLDGRNIQRLTDSEGFDGLISTSTLRSEITFISTRRNTKDAYIMKTNSNNLTRLPIGKDESDSIVQSPSGKYVAWTRSPSEIWISNLYGAKSQKVMADKFTNIDPVWHPNEEEILFSSNRDDKENFELYVIKKDGSCLRRLTYHSAHDRLPDISPDGKKLLYSSLRTGKWQLYLTEYAPPPCPAPPESLQSNP